MTQPQTTARPASARRRVWPHRLVALALVLAGGAVTGWPVVETYANNTQTAREVTQYADAVASAASANPEPLHADLARAADYNAALSPSALWDPWGTETPGQSPAHDDYLSQLAAFDAMGRVRIPQIAVDLPIYHDATAEALARGAGHLYGTSLPVGGPDTHAVLAAHTAYTGSTFFDRLPEVTLGETFYIDTYGATLTYQVDAISIVEAWELEAVERVPGADHLTLVTCITPPGAHLQRLLVRGVRVPDASAGLPADPTTRTPGDAVDAQTPAVPSTTTASTDTSVQTWMWPRLWLTGAAVALALLMSISWIIGDLRRARRVPADVLDPDAAPQRAEALVPDSQLSREPVKVAR